jgi:hypothetical protein
MARYAGPIDATYSISPTTSAAAQNARPGFRPRFTIRTASQTQNAANATPKTDRATAMPGILSGVERGREG